MSVWFHAVTLSVVYIKSRPVSSTRISTVPLHHAKNPHSEVPPRKGRALLFRHLGKIRVEMKRSAAGRDSGMQMQRHVRHIRTVLTTRLHWDPPAADTRSTYESLNPKPLKP